MFDSELIICSIILKDTYYITLSIEKVKNRNNTIRLTSVIVSLNIVHGQNFKAKGLSNHNYFYLKIARKLAYAVWENKVIFG